MPNNRIEHYADSAGAPSAKLMRDVRRTSVTAEITAAAGAEGKNPSRLNFNNR